MNNEEISKLIRLKNIIIFIKMIWKITYLNKFPNPLSIILNKSLLIGHNTLALEKLS